MSNTNNSNTYQVILLCIVTVILSILLYLINDKTDKIVCYPSIWFGTSSPHNTKDLCPPNWVKINS